MTKVERALMVFALFVIGLCLAVAAVVSTVDERERPCHIPGGLYREDVTVTWSNCGIQEYAPVRWVEVREGQLGCGHYTYRTLHEGEDGCNYESKWTGFRGRDGTWRETGEIKATCASGKRCAYMAEARGALNKETR